MNKPKTAEQWVFKICNCGCAYNTEKIIELAMSEARNHAIEECANKAENVTEEELDKAENVTEEELDKAGYELHVVIRGLKEKK